MSGLELAGIHHLTAVTADAAGNHRFYTQILGMRLVKKTVNQDDVSAYHLFYADGLATPGTDLTFFDWPVPPERRGTRSVSRTGLLVKDATALSWWHEHLGRAGVERGPVQQRDGRMLFEFQDPEGQRLAIVQDSGSARGQPWDRSPIPAGHQIRGLGPLWLSVPVLGPTRRVLEEVLNLRLDRTYPAEHGAENVHVFAMGSGGPAAELHVLAEPNLPPARQGAGAVHHLALRCPTLADYEAWEKRLAGHGLPSSGPIDRFYFRSLYFREPNGILFEIATDEPGFTADEPLETLGERLALPPFLEARRAAIEKGLKRL